ncbi:MAG: hypothetical protein NC344_11435 [Bacteroidales bacterium]|nr:hypothetical protein [Bacteroidales bacterium]MCM1148418.1 hypothetical protein [Bacteroidales bacterium]MCM1207272.1 hypothetical protein [Bacillota bacterium]MCM1511495.1 hypothetical protein [Clostridium sp.]
MKHFLILTLLLPSLFAKAETVSDTTFVYGNKQIVVCDTNNVTSVSVLNQDGEELRKTSETTFVDGQEVTQVYVTSPFLPNKWNPNREEKLYSHIPWLSYGMATMGGSAMSFGSNDDLHMSTSKSWEIAFTPLSIAVPLNAQRTFGLSFGMQVVWVKMHFKELQAMFNDNGQISVRPMELGEGETFRKSYISYQAIRIPVYLEYQHIIKNREIFTTLGLSLEWRSNEHSRYKTNQNTITPTNDIHLNPIGLNLDFQLGYAGIAFYIRTALTPLMKTKYAPKAYPISIGAAFSL